jgi:hypothetical protein
VRAEGGGGTGKERGVSVRCPLGGPAPCVDDLCNGVDTTLCGLELGFDFCPHDNDPDECEECAAESDDWDSTAGQDCGCGECLVCQEVSTP